MLVSKDIDLAILCGGESKRLGQDKGLYRPLGDEPLIVRSIRMMAGSFRRIFVVVRDRDQARKYDEVLVSDLSSELYAKTKLIWDEMAGSTPVRSSMSGVLTSLRYIESERVAVLPVDQIGVRRLHLNRLIESSDSTCAFENEAGELIPFPSLWPKSAREAVASRASQGSLGVKNCLRELGVQTVVAPEYEEELGHNGNTQKELQQYFGVPLHDPFQRRLHYLRFSLTEACNLSCTYCLPDGFPEWYRHKATLSQEDIITVLKGFRRLGFRKVRFTGGEPTVHKGCLAAVVSARKLGFEEIALTTNGLLIKGLKQWQDAGLTHINVSYDSVDDDAFFKLTKSKKGPEVKALIEEAARLGLNTKVNAVLIRSINGSQAQIEQMIAWAMEHPITLRFIELMETGLNKSFSDQERVLGTEILPIAQKFGLQNKRQSRGIDIAGPATVYEHLDAPGKIGFINPMSCNFCDKCNRLRVTARGRLRLCLFGDGDTALDLVDPIGVEQTVRQIIGGKPEKHYLEDGDHGNVATFRTIGG